MIKFRELIGEILSPWPLKRKISALAIVGVAYLLTYSFAGAVRQFSWSLVERRDAIAASLLPVNASLLGFSITSFSVLLSVRKDEKLVQLSDNFPRASRQLWTALISASWATSAGALTALAVVLLKNPALPQRIQSALTAWLFLTEGYVALTFFGVIAVIQSIVTMLIPREDKAPTDTSSTDDATNLLGFPGDDM